MLMSEAGFDDGWESMMIVVQDKSSNLRSKSLAHKSWPCKAS